MGLTPQGGPLQVVDAANIGITIRKVPAGRVGSGGFFDQLQLSYLTAGYYLW
jgi:hypothetical protein